MSRRKKVELPPSRFEHVESGTIHGRKVEPGTELSIVGEGRMRFHSFVKNLDTGTEWVDCIDKKKQFRSFHVDRVKRVHYKNKLGR